MLTRTSVLSLMNDAWTEPGFCVPNADTYPFQWLWDSCFHAIIWAELEDPRCVVELEHVLAHQHSDGFVPHMSHWGDPNVHSDFWGQPMTSSITQPPMYGHALSVVAAKGFEVSADLVQRAAKGLANLLARPRTEIGLIPVWHPWETGCDNSARWDDWCPAGFDFDRWRQYKSELVLGQSKTPEGAMDGSEFGVPSVGFNALTIWNARELLTVASDRGMSESWLDELDQGAAELATNLAKRWNPELVTWTDADSGSGQARTLDAMLPLLVDPKPEAFSVLVDPKAYGAPFGPRGAHVDEPTYDPNSYWRGPAWPQLSYLVWMAAVQAGSPVAVELRNCLTAGATKSGLAEYWNGDTGTGLGAIPQTWAGLGYVASGQLKAG